MSIERIQWRHNNGYDSILLIDESGLAVQWCDAATSGGTVLAEAVSAFGNLDDWKLGDAEASQPESFGELVMERHRSGEVTEMDADLFRKRLSFQFRTGY